MGGAGGPVLGSLADVYANPVMVNALNLGREATILTKDTDNYAPASPDYR